MRRVLMNVIVAAAVVHGTPVWAQNATNEPAEGRPTLPLPQLFAGEGGPQGFYWGTGEGRERTVHGVNSRPYSLAVRSLLERLAIAKAMSIPELGSIVQEESTVASDQWRSATKAFVENFNAGDLTAATQNATDALDVALHFFGAKHPYTADSLNKLGLLFEARGDYDAAREYYSRSLDILETHADEFSAEIGTALNNLGNIFVLKDDLEQAELMHLRALQVRTRTAGAESAPVAQSLFNLGVVYEKRNLPDNAELLFKQSAAVWTRIHGPTHLNVANSYHKLANIYAATGKTRAAEQLYLSALQIRRELLGPKHLSVAESLMGVGRACTKQEKYDEAGPVFRQAVDIMEESLGAFDPRVAMALYSLANVYHIQAKLEDAYNRDFAAKVTASGNTSESDSLDSQRISALHDQLILRAGYVRELYERADPLYVRAASIFQKAYGADHPTLKIINDELSMLRNTVSSKAAMLGVR